MTGEALLVGAGALAAIVATAAWIAWPLLLGRVPADPPDARAVALLARRESALATLRDLELDYADGRLKEVDYRASRERTIAEGAAALAALDSLNEDLAGRSGALAARVESDVASARGAGTEEARECGQCGQVAAVSDRYCSSCGARLEGPPVARS